MLKLKAPQGVCHSHQLLHSKKWAKNKSYFFPVLWSNMKAKWSIRIAKNPQNLKNHLPPFYCCIIKVPCRYEGRESIPWQIFHFLCEFKGIHSLHVLEMQGNGLGSGGIWHAKESTLFLPVASRRQCCSVNKPRLIPTPEKQ